MLFSVVGYFVCVSQVVKSLDIFFVIFAPLFSLFIITHFLRGDSGRSTPLFVSSSYINNLFFNVRPCVERRPLSRDESTKFLLVCRYSSAISALGNRYEMRKLQWLILLLIVLLTPSIAASAILPCLIATGRISSKFGALAKRL